MTKRLIVWAIVVALILTIPLAMQFTHEVQWNEAVAYGVMLLAAGGVYELWRWLKTRTRAYRIAFGAGLAGALLLGWVSGAVGIIGSEDNPANLMYGAVPAALLIGSLIARLKPRGMARTLFVAALVQMLVPVAALLIWPAQASWGEAGVIGVFVFNFIFAVPFVVSALLFRRVSVTDSKWTDRLTSDFTACRAMKSEKNFVDKENALYGSNVTNVRPHHFSCRCS